MVVEGVASVLIRSRVDLSAAMGIDNSFGWMPLDITNMKYFDLSHACSRPKAAVITSEFVRHDNTVGAQ